MKKLGIAVLVVALPIFIYALYSLVRPYFYPKYSGIIDYHECSATELSFGCGKILLKTNSETYILDGSVSAVSYNNKEVDVWGDAVKVQDQGPYKKAIYVRKIHLR